MWFDFEQEDTGLPYLSPHGPIRARACLTELFLLSPQMCCVQIWRFNLIGLSPAAPVMVLKRFQVCANCCFPNSNMQHLQYVSTTRSGLYFWKHFLHFPKTFIACQEFVLTHSFSLFPWEYKVKWFNSWPGGCWQLSKYTCENKTLVFFKIKFDSGPIQSFTSWFGSLYQYGWPAGALISCSKILELTFLSRIDSSALSEARSPSFSGR